MTAVTNTVVMNRLAPEVLIESVELGWGKVVPQSHKYVPLNRKNVSKLDYPAQCVLALMSQYFQGGFKSTLFDYKVMELSEGDCGCKLPEWHIDVTRNPNHSSREDVHIIYSTHVGTEFMVGAFETTVEDFAGIRLPNLHGLWQAPPNSITRFRRSNLHRGPFVKEACKRVVIRVTQTDII